MASYPPPMPLIPQFFMGLTVIRDPILAGQKPKNKNQPYLKQTGLYVNSEVETTRYGVLADIVRAR
ncbi:MAG: hypothetical protein GC201_10325 [Alphaproteobacteria bacterium]|nr:hypothetical protein [Alphaproteobacteria bacterium]